MRVGVPREVKDNEFRVAITPAGVAELSRAGHVVHVESGAGEGSSITDREYAEAGARVLRTPAEVWGEAELLLKVKEPVAEEYRWLRKDLVIFAYLHLAASGECTRAIVDSGVTAIAYETVQLPDGSLPLLAPMSEVAGRLAPQVGAHTLMRAQGGRGSLLGGVPGVRPAKAVIIGAGVAGMNAAAIAVGLGADVTVLDRDIEKLRLADRQYRGRLKCVASSEYEITRACLDADLVIGAVLVAGAKAPSLVSDSLVSRMKPRAVLVDISVDQGGCFESTRPTTHAEPTFAVGECIFYCVANMPGAVPNTSTFALTNVTLRHAGRIADLGWREAVRQDSALRMGVNCVEGQITYKPVAEAHDLSVVELDEVC